MAELRFMSWNIKGRGARSRAQHIEEVAETIVALDPDVVGLQEVHRLTRNAGGIDQFETLQRLTGLQGTFGRSFERNDGGDYGNAVLTRGRVITSDVHLLPGTGEPRTMLASTVELDGQRFVFYVTHLSAWGRLGRKNRMLQTAVATEIITGGDSPFVLAGDFNTGPSAAELRQFHGGDLVISCFAKPSITHRTTRSCLDYIFVDPGWEVTASEIVKKGPSDHWPLLAQLRREVRRKRRHAGSGSAALR